jgi:sigma54-dependent transcription regulator
MNSEPASLPDNWSLRSNEISANVYRITAKATDGRCIEVTATETELDRLTREVMDSIKESDRQLAERFKRTR